MSWLERLLPWYDSHRESQRDAATERITIKSEVARERAARVIAAYRRADDAQRRAGEALIDEMQRYD